MHAAALFENADAQRKLVMAGLVPAIHVFLYAGG
jgi:hypothetical protein